ncbi:MAG: DUF5615 family PIN-like protein, partial [Maioricimonas sp. JB049]
MKVLLDTCVWGGVVDELRLSGHDVNWVGKWLDDPGDSDILAYAHAETRVLVTLDKDFGEIAIVHRTPHHGIVRLVNCPARQQGAVCNYVLSRYCKELQAGAIITVDPRRIRVRDAEPFPDGAPEGTNLLPLDPAEILSWQNWQRAVIEAIDSLPNDIRSSVGHSPPTTKSVVVFVSVEPLEADQETHVARVELNWWDSMRDRGWPRELDGLYGAGGIHEEQAEWPVITVFGKPSGFEQGIYPERAPVAHVQCEVHRAVLEEMWGGGGISMIAMDDQDRFVREDGSPILLWQFESDEEY